MTEERAAPLPELTDAALADGVPEDEIVLFSADFSRNSLQRMTAKYSGFGEQSRSCYR